MKKINDRLKEFRELSHLPPSSTGNGLSNGMDVFEGSLEEALQSNEGTVLITQRQWDTMDHFLGRVNALRTDADQMEQLVAEMRRLHSKLLSEPGCHRGETMTMTMTMTIDGQKCLRS